MGSGLLRNLLTLLLCATFCPISVADDSKHNPDKHFTLKVFPLLKEKCFGCHGTDPNDLRGDYNMLTRDALIKGGESGDVALVPGDPDESIVYQAVMWDGYEMPPKETDRLDEAQTEIVRKWILDGAPWPSDEVQKKIRIEERTVRVNEEGMIVDTSGGTSDDWTYRRYQENEIWAFQPLSKPDLPEAIHSEHAIDRFIDRRLDEAKLEPAKQADPHTLIRRLSFDLTGLPPTPREIHEFKIAYKQDPAQAWNELVDRLLESDQYGERQAQHWLDVVRYADTAGFSNDYERSNAWRYRDYVIRSFNNDKPFNEFVVEQVAGDEHKEGDVESLIATGFLRMGPWGTAMIPQPEARQIYLDDLVHNVGQSFMAMPMRCCKCHDHKFDPIPTRDYYQMYAAFATTQPAELGAEFLPEENLNGFEENKELVRELLDYARNELKTVNDKMEAAAKKWYEENDLPYKNEKARKDDPEDKKPPRHVGLTPEETGIKKVREQDVWIWERRLERFEPMVQAVYNGQDDWKNARKLRKAKKIKQDWRPENFILSGGALEAKSEPVKPGVISAIGLAAGESGDAPWEVSDGLSGRRLDLAKWMTDDRNPLTARVIVNRVWQWHFGVGLVKTSNNFGVKGNKPTHPELLDWLTSDFIQNGWKLKRLHKLIVTSEVYRRSCLPADMERQATVDPNNELLASFTPRRLTAEELRDGILKVTGELNPEMGGLPIMPEINMEVALQPRMIQFSIAPAHQPSRTAAQRNRRTIYSYRVRGQADPFLEIMNQPNPNESCELRDSASVSPQAFTLLNSDVMTDRSIAFARRIEREANKKVGNLFPTDDDVHLVRRAVQLAFGRVPSKKEQAQLLEYYQEMKSYHADNTPEEVKYPKQVVRSLVEEFTGKPFEFIEILNVYKNYEPDAKPWTVDSDTRALADVCLLLLNSNEFMFVY